MNFWIQIKYAKVVSPHLDRFSVKSEKPFRAQFRCPYCGDSRKSKTKARGNLFEKENSLIYKCFNCGHSTSFKNFLHDVDSSIYHDFCFEMFREGKSEVKTPNISKPKVTPTIDGLQKLSALPSSHIAKKYVESRKIPSNQHFRIFFAQDFNGWINSIIPDKLEDYEEQRLVFPIFSKEKELKGVIGRSLNKKTNQRYLTVMFDQNFPKIFGLETINFNKKIYVLEGPIDSFFLSNSIALAGTHGPIQDYLKEYKENMVIILDNQPRNQEVCNILKNKYISNGFHCFIYPEFIKQKDINEMILSGYNTSQIKSIIDSNTYSNLKAKIKFSKWKRVNDEKRISSIS